MSRRISVRGTVYCDDEALDLSKELTVPAVPRVGDLLEEDLGISQRVRAVTISPRRIDVLLDPIRAAGFTADEWVSRDGSEWVSEGWTVTYPDGRRLGGRSRQSTMSRERHAGGAKGPSGHSYHMMRDEEAHSSYAFRAGLRTGIYSSTSDLQRDLQAGRCIWFDPATGKSVDPDFDP